VSSEHEHVSGERCYPTFLVSLAIDSTLVSYIKKGVSFITYYHGYITLLPYDIQTFVIHGSKLECIYNNKTKW